MRLYTTLPIGNVGGGNINRVNVNFLSTDTAVYLI